MKTFKTLTIELSKTEINSIKNTFNKSFDSATTGTKSFIQLFLMELKKGNTIKIQLTEHSINWELSFLREFDKNKALTSIANELIKQS